MSAMYAPGGSVLTAKVARSVKTSGSVQRANDLAWRAEERNYARHDESAHRGEEHERRRDRDDGQPKVGEERHHGDFDE